MFKNFSANPEYVPGGVHNFWIVHPPRTDDNLSAGPRDDGSGADSSGRTRGGGGGFVGGFFTNNSATAEFNNNDNCGNGGLMRAAATNGKATPPPVGGKIEEKFGGIGNLIGAFFSNHTM
eukprot:TRINITY_DN8405_c0_g1_i9.p2 TRINITY_DN8405_c0_g1~~TRINITY_DN8405_c0_g1_i9.p2  ORF type:complete len:120 (-),score=30.86 TRINITY_DN8405_c0_g1_i9:138-497(-)